jgi:phosphoglycolate phosphatase
MNQPHTIAAVAFDLDGTLIDSAPDISLALNAALAQEGLQRFDLATVRAWIGDGPDVLIARALAEQGVGVEMGNSKGGGNGDTDIDPEGAALRLRLRRAFDMATLAAPLVEGFVYPGILDLLAGLHGVLPMVVVTNKPTPLARAVLGAAGILPFVAQVQGADTAPLRKPAPAMLLAAAQALGVAPARLLMVGDGPADMLAAHAAGCPAALVAWGYGGHAVPAHLTPRHIATPQQLLGELLKSREQIVNT